MTTTTLQLPAARFLAVMPVSFGVTFLILFLMFQLINKDFGEVPEPVEPTKIATIINDDLGDMTSRFKSFEKPEKPMPPETQPAIPEVEIDTTVEPNKNGLVTKITPTKTTINLNADNQVMPFIKVQPSYPATAAAKGIEGYVDVVFDVAVTGATENIRVETAYPSSIFNRSVIAAVKRWKYKPKMVDGTPLASFNIRERITFELEKG